MKVFTTCRGMWSSFFVILLPSLVTLPHFAAAVSLKVLSSPSSEAGRGYISLLHEPPFLELGQHAVQVAMLETNLTLTAAAPDIGRLLHLQCEVGAGLDLGLHVSQGCLVLSGICLLGGALAMSFAVAEVSYKQTMEARSDLVLKTTCYCYCLYRPCQTIANLFMIFSFWFCGFYSWMVAAIVINVASQLYLAYEYVFAYNPGEKGADETGRRIARGLACLLQFRAFLDADDSLSKGKLTTSFARQRFLESLTESGPLAILSVYVLFYLEHQNSIWLVISLCGSVIGMGWGVVTWLVYSLDEQLIADETDRAKASDPIPETGESSPASQIPGISRTPSASPSVPKLNLAVMPVPAVHKIAVADRYIKWYHQLLWICYFTMDYSCRLLTIGLFLKIRELRPMSQLVFLFVGLSYFIAICAAISHYEAQRQHVEVWKVGGEILKVPKEKVAHRIVDCLILTFLVHILPADVRREPKDSEESRVMIALCPEVRDKLVRVTIPLRIVDYFLLGSVALYYDPDVWQWLALGSIFFVAQILLIAVLWLQRVMSQILPTDLAVPETVRRYLEDDGDSVISSALPTVRDPLSSPPPSARPAESAIFRGVSK